MSIVVIGGIVVGTLLPHPASLITEDLIST